MTLPDPEAVFDELYAYLQADVQYRIRCDIEAYRRWAANAHRPVLPGFEEPLIPYCSACTTGRPWLCRQRCREKLRRFDEQPGLLEQVIRARIAKARAELLEKPDGDAR